MSNSFITNVNTLVDNLSAVYTANEKLTPEVINQLTALNLVQLQAVYVELAKIVDVQANMSSVVTTAGAIESIVTLANYLDAASAPSIVEDLILINSKLDALTASVDFLTETITGLGSAQLAIESQSSPVFADIPTVPTIMPFNVETPSSNTDIISTDALQDTITFKLNGSYTFTSNVSVTSKTNATVALTFKIVDIATGNVLATESNTVHISKHSTATLPLTTLLTISNAPVTVRVEAQSTASGYELTAFNSLLVSSVTVGLPDIYAERLYVVEKDSSTGAANLPSGNTAERPVTAELGAIRYNTDINEYEGYTDSGWESLAAGATGSNGDNVFLITDKVMTTDYTVPENKRAVAFGDVELIGDLTIPNNSELLVLGDYKDGMVVVNDISKLSTVNTSVSTNVAVKSYHNGLEGGGGVFYYDSTKPRTEHNGGTVIAPNAVFPSDWNNQVQLAAWFDGSSLTGNGCWVRSYDGAVDVKWFGTKGDGVTDDTLPMQKAISLFSNVAVKNGIYCVYNLTLNSRSNFISDNATIKAISSSSLSLIEVDNHCFIDGFTLDGNNKNIRLIGALKKYNSVVANLKLVNQLATIQGDQGSAQFLDCNNMVVHDIDIENCASGISLIKTTDTYVNSITAKTLTGVTPVVVSIQNACININVSNIMALDNTYYAVTWYGGDAANIAKQSEFDETFTVTDYTNYSNIATTHNAPRQITVSNVVHTGTGNKACVWGSKGINITVAGSVASLSRDVSFDAEGSLNVLFTGCVSNAPVNGGLATFFAGRNISFVNCSVYLQGSGRPFILKGSSSGEGTDNISISNCNFVNTSTTTMLYGLVEQGPQDIKVQGTSFVNCGIESVNNRVNTSILVIKDNTVDMTVSGNYNWVILRSVMKTVIDGNVCTRLANESSPSTEDSCIYLTKDNNRLRYSDFSKITNNTISGWVYSVTLDGSSDIDGGWSFYEVRYNNFSGNLAKKTVKPSGEAFTRFSLSESFNYNISGDVSVTSIDY